MKYKINLLSEKELSFSDKFLYFLTHYLRYIIVITQLVVIIVFFYRFQIDQRIIDLRESVDQKKEIIEIVFPLLKEAERIDKKSQEIKKIINKQNKFILMNKYFLSIFPETVVLTDFKMTEDSITITGNSSNPYHLQAFFKLLKKDNRFEKIELKSIKRTDLGYIFTLSLDKFKG